MGSGLTSLPSRTNRISRCLASSCSERDTFGCARPVRATSAATLAGRSRSTTPNRSSASRDRAASSGAAGSGEACRSPRATARISSRIVVLYFQFDLFCFKFERRAFLPAGLLDGVEEVADQFIRAPKIVGHQFRGAPETVPMVISLRARDAVRVVEAQ
jgi:hypothetical protein